MMDGRHPEMSVEEYAAQNGHTPEEVVALLEAHEISLTEAGLVPADTLLAIGERILLNMGYEPTVQSPVVEITNERRRLKHIPTKRG